MQLLPQLPWPSRNDLNPDARVYIGSPFSLRFVIADGIITGVEVDGPAELISPVGRAAVALSVGLILRDNGPENILGAINHTFGAPVTWTFPAHAGLVAATHGTFTFANPAVLPAATLAQVQVNNPDVLSGATNNPGNAGPDFGNRQVGDTRRAMYTAAVKALADYEKIGGLWVLIE
jgi:hypothetical protein